MKPMPPAALAELDGEIDRTVPATPEKVLDLVRHRRAALYGTTEQAVTRGTNQVLVGLPPVMRRLLEAETALTTLRGLVADVLAELGDGERILTDDLRRRLQATGIDLEEEIADAAALRHAEATVGAML